MLQLSFDYHNKIELTAINNHPTKPTASCRIKLLLDENLSRRMIPHLEPHYPHSTQVSLIGLEQSTDMKIWEHARLHDFVIVTCDSDFYDLTLLKGVPPRVIWLQTGNTTRQHMAHLLIRKSLLLLIHFKE